MAAYVAGDAAAFRVLFDRLAPQLLRLCARGLGSKSEAEDLVQQTFLQLHRARFEFRAGARLRPFVVTIALNLRRDLQRRGKFRGESPRPIEELADPRGNAADELERARVRRALDRLPPDQREVIELHWLEGLSFPEVAEIVGASAGAVRVRAHRGYQKLREELADAAPDSRAAVPGEEAAS